MKTSKKMLIGVGIFLLLLLITWGVCETAGSDYYNYKGYVVDMTEDSNGNSVIITLCGNKETRFTLRWYTKIKLTEEKKSFTVGDLVLLSTTHFSDTNVKKISVDSGYSTEGKLIYVNEIINTPFILTTNKTTNVMHLINIVMDSKELSGASTGDNIIIYHTTPLSSNTITINADAIKFISDNSVNSLTDEELSFILSKGYTIK